MTENGEPRRVFYAASVHGESEIEAVVDVLRDPRGLWVGRRVGAMERAVAPLFGKQSGVMVNSGSSALYLAIELLGARPGDEIIGSAVTFSTDISPIVRAGLVPVFVDVEPETYVVDIGGIEEMITDRHAGPADPQPDRQRPGLGCHPPDRRPSRAPRDRGLLRRARRHAARHADGHAIRPQRDELCLLAHHHLCRRGRDAAARRRGAAGPGAPAPPLGSAIGAALLRIETA